MAMTRAEVATVLGISEQRVLQIENRVLRQAASGLTLADLADKIDPRHGTRWLDRYSITSWPP